VLDLGRVAVGQMDGGMVPVIVERNQEVLTVSRSWRADASSA
jgi:hypothetical protein